MGRDDFMRKYGGRPAERYVVVTEIEDVDALALLLGARSLAGMDVDGPWRGDQVNVADPLRALGFRVQIAGRQEAPEVQTAELAVQDAAGSVRRSGRVGGQGFMVDQQAKVAIEARAMELALQHYARLGTVTNTALQQSWDYEVDVKGICWHVEVKGTTGEALDVILTPNEVAHARSYPHVALYLVSNIEVGTNTDGQTTAGGGIATILHPWIVDDGELRPLAYKYRLPT